MNSKVKAAVDYGPLLIFFAAFYTLGIMPATAAIIGATIIALAVSYYFERKLAPMPLISGILITVFGGITLFLNDPIYLVLKSSIFYTLAATALGVGLYLDKPFLKFVFGHAFKLPHHAWRILTWRWIALFLVLAGGNMIVWQTFGLEVWVNFKVIGIMAILFLFTMAQMPFIMRHQEEEASPGSDN